MTDATMAPAAAPAAGKSDAMNALLAHNWWAVMLRGVATIVFGLIALFLPGVTLGSLVLVFAAYMLVDGVLAIASGIRAARRGERWGLLAVEGAADILAGAIALAFPGITLLVLAGIIVAWAIISGVLMLWSAFRVKRTHGRGWAILGGAASIIWGGLLAFFPLTGLVVLTWWLGAYALVFGVSLLVMAARLRRRDADPSEPHPHQAQPA